jgi:hypothetical protein
MGLVEIHLLSNELQVIASGTCRHSSEEQMFHHSLCTGSNPTDLQPSRLVGKLANICPDRPSHHLQGTSVFKAVVGGDPKPPNN